MRVLGTISVLNAGSSSPIHNPLIIVAAGLVAAVVILIGAILLFRSSGKKKRAQMVSPEGMPDWQRQSQQAAPGAGNMNSWGQQSAGMQADNPWGQPAGQQGWGAQPQNPTSWGSPNGMQQPAGWGIPNQNPGQQQQSTGWGAQTAASNSPSQSGWDGQNAQQANGWGTSGPAQQSGWGAQNSPQPASWGSQAQNPAQQQPIGWANPGAPTGAAMSGQQPWETGVPGHTPSAQDAWMQQPAGWNAPQNSQAQQPPQSPSGPWDMQGNAAAQSQQAPTAYGGNPPGAAPWGGQSVQQGYPAAEAWAQTAPPAQQGGWPQSYASPASGTPNPNASPPPMTPNPNMGNAPVPPWLQQAQMQSPQGFGNVAPVSDESDKTVLRSMGPQGPQPSGVSGGLGIVRIEEGKEPGRIYEVRKEALSIGRSRESDIFLEDLAVSRLHASILNQGNGNYALRDEGSANGTKVNGTTVNKYQPYPLQEGDKIQLGQTVLVFAKR